MTFAQEAKEALVERFLDGGKVNGVIFRDLLDAEIDGNYRWAVSEFESLFLTAISDPSAGSDKARKYAEALIEKFLRTHPDLVTELAAAMQQDYAESQRAA